MTAWWFLSLLPSFGLWQYRDLSCSWSHWWWDHCTRSAKTIKGHQKEIAVFGHFESWGEIGTETRLMPSLTTVTAREGCSDTTVVLHSSGSGICVPPTVQCWAPELLAGPVPQQQLHCAGGDQAGATVEHRMNVKPIISSCSCSPSQVSTLLLVPNQCLVLILAPGLQGAQVGVRTWRAKGKVNPSLAQSCWFVCMKTVLTTASNWVGAGGWEESREPFASSDACATQPSCLIFSHCFWSTSLANQRNPLPLLYNKFPLFCLLPPNFPFLFLPFLLSPSAGSYSNTVNERLYCSAPPDSVGEAPRAFTRLQCPSTLCCRGSLNNEDTLS